MLNETQSLFYKVLFFSDFEWDTECLGCEWRWVWGLGRRGHSTNNSL